MGRDIVTKLASQANCMTEAKITFELPPITTVPSVVEQQRFQLTGIPVPQYLYKYYPPQPEIVRSLFVGYVRFTNPLAFNDLLDSRYLYDDSLTAEQFKEALDTSIPLEINSGSTRQSLQEQENGLRAFYLNTLHKFGPEWLTKAREQLAVFKESLSTVAIAGGIFCLSEVGNNPAMWSNYATPHGFVVEFQTKDNLVCFDAARVEYFLECPIINIHRILMEARFYREHYKTILIKNHHFSYEREWRTWKKEAGFYPFSHRYISRIIYGPRTSADTRRALTGILTKWPWIRLAEARQHEQQLDYEIVNIV